MKRVALVMVALALAIISCGCSKSPSVIVSFNKGKCVIDLSPVRTIGNHSFVPLNLKGESYQHTEEILLVLNEFEDKHPRLETVDWKIQQKTVSNGNDPVIVGLWIDHRKKK
jgi:hypothetical protein